MARIKDADSKRFFYGGSVSGAVGPRPGCPPSIVLERLVEPKKSRFGWLAKFVPRWLKTEPSQEVFALKRRIAYQSRLCDKPHIVPADKTFRSDLTSVPDVFAWLVPRTGLHLPAALLHDGLVHDPNSPATYIGPSVTRAQADRIFRDAMFDLGAGFFRRWLMWSAVSLATVWAGLSTPTREAAQGKPVKRSVALCNWYYRVVVFGSLGAIAVLGTLATLDGLDWWDGVFWMPEGSHVAEFGRGLAAAVGTPLVLSVFWLKLQPAGAITGVALALLLHVTAALVVLTVAFQILEYLARLRRKRRDRSAKKKADAAGEIRSHANPALP
jgi:hypothetical protein